MTTSESKKSTNLNIDSVQKYEALYRLFMLLQKLDVSSEKSSRLSLVYRFGDDYERCDHCNSPHCECSCQHEYWNDRYDVYNDESSFE